MPKRVLDGEALWGSNKLDNVEPDWARAEYAWIHALAFSNGVFEANPRAIWARCYAYNRPDITSEDVEVVLAAFVRARLLFVWVEGGKRWGYWTGSDKPGRLPRESWRKRDAARGKLGPDPPEDQLRTFLNGGLTESARSRRGGETPEACNLDGGGVLGSGFGSGSGLGSGELLLSEAEASDEKVKASLQTDPRKQALQEVSRELAELLSTRILENNPKSELGKPSTRQKRVQKWSIEIERMIQIDGENPEEVRQLIEFTQRDAFWCTNILSAGKLREKRDQLRLKMQREGRNHATPGSREQTGSRGNGRAQPLARSQQEPPAHRKRSVI